MNCGGPDLGGTAWGKIHSVEKRWGLEQVTVHGSRLEKVLRSSERYQAEREHYEVILITCMMEI